MTAAKKPIHEIRNGKIRCTVWENQNEYGPKYNFAFSRLYKSENGWRNSDYFAEHDLLTIAELAQRAQAWAGGTESSALETGEQTATEGN